MGKIEYWKPAPWIGADWYEVKISATSRSDLYSTLNNVIATFNPDPTKYEKVDSVSWYSIAQDYTWGIVGVHMKLKAPPPKTTIPVTTVQEQNIIIAATRTVSNIKYDYYNKTLTFDVTVKNTGNKTYNFVVGATILLYKKYDKVIDLPIQTTGNLEPKISKTLTFSYKGAIPECYDHGLIVSVWDRNPRETGAKRLADQEIITFHPEIPKEVIQNIIQQSQGYIQSGTATTGTVTDEIKKYVESQITQTKEVMTANDLLIQKQIEEEVSNAQSQIEQIKNIVGGMLDTLYYGSLSLVNIIAYGFLGIISTLTSLFTFTPQQLVESYKDIKKAIDEIRKLEKGE